MAKVVIVNATQYIIHLKAKWHMDLVGDKSEEKTIEAFSSGYIDNVLYDLTFSVTTTDRPYITDNHGKIKGPDTWAYLVSCKDGDKCECDELVCGDHKPFPDAIPMQIHAIKQYVKCLKEKIAKETGELKKELEATLKQAEDALKALQ